MRKISVIINSSNDVVQSAVLRLEKEDFLEVKAVLGWGSNKPSVFPQAETIDQWKLIDAGLAGGLEGVDIRFLTSDLVKKTYWAEGLALAMMDRIDPLKHQTYFQRKNLYRYLICYWSQYVQKVNLKLFISGEAPHEVSDFILFVVCKALKIKTILFNYSSLPGMVYVSDGYTTFPAYPLAENNRSSIDNVLSDSILNYLTKIRSNYKEAIPVYAIENFAMVQKFAKENAGLKRSINIIKKKYRQLIMLLSLFKKFNAVNFWERVRDFGQTRLNMMAWHKIKQEYVSRTINFVKPDKFVYFLLNFQPENTTSPLGGEFVDQLLAIAMLARTLPDHITILVKEHPMQLLEHGHYNYIGRDVNFYGRICSLANVRLVPFEADHFELLDTSVCVACVNGTVGWEAIVRGKATLVFGEAWFQGAPGAYRVKQDKDCKIAIDHIINDFSFTEDALMKYLHIFINSCDEIYFNDAGARYAHAVFDFEKNIDCIYSILKCRFIANSRYEL